MGELRSAGEREADLGVGGGITRYISYLRAQMGVVGAGNE